MSALKLVYLCTHNACRSVLCEVISRELASDRLAVASAGSAAAGRIHPLTLKVLQARGCDVETLRSQGIDEFRAFDPDVCDPACWFLPFRQVLQHIELCSRRLDCRLCQHDGRAQE